MEIIRIKQTICNKLQGWQEKREELSRRREVTCPHLRKKVIWREDDKGVDRCQEANCPEQNKSDVGGVPISRGIYVSWHGRGVVERCDSAIHKKPEDEGQMIVGNSNNGIEIY